MRHLVFDIETDDLKATKIWCICAVDEDTHEEFVFGPDELEEGYAFLHAADKLVGHNIIGFDIPIVEKFSGLSFKDIKLVDTLVLSRLFNPVREGGHGLERWGYVLGDHKIDFHEYTVFSQEMLDYCMQDVRLNLKVFNALKRESKGFSAESVHIEMETFKIICAQRDTGFMLDIPAAEKLLAELNSNMADIVDQVHTRFVPKKESLLITPLFNKGGALSKSGRLKDGKRVRLTDFEYNELEEGNNKIKRRNEKSNSTLGINSTVCIYRNIITEFKLGSRKQIGEYLIDFGWKPKVFTPTGQPQVDEKILSRVKDIPEAGMIATYLMYQKRIAQVESWLEKCEDDSRVHGFVNSNGTITGRMTHNSPNLAQVPNSNSPYGKECRACWTVPQGRKLVGIDASGLELRMLAHYLNDEVYTNEILNGDIHTANQKLAGLESRNQAKTFIYALLYGAGDAKLGSVAGGGRSIGARLRKSFFDNLPAFLSLKDRVAREAKRGFVKALDGRKVFVRSEHAALNSLLQSAGSLVMKKALIIFNDKIKDLSANFVMNVHDEWQLEVDETIADTVGTLGVESIIEAGNAFNLNCPLDGEYNVGSNWSETH